MPKQKEAPVPAAPSGAGLPLTVRRSHVRIAGATRVNDAILAKLGGARKDLVVVAHDKRSVALHVFADPMVPKGSISLRTPAMQRLGVKEGEQVTLLPYTTAREVVGTSLRRAAKRLGRKMDVEDDEEKD